MVRSDVGSLLLPLDSTVNYIGRTETKLQFQPGVTEDQIQVSRHDIPRVQQHDTVMLIGRGLDSEYTEGPDSFPAARAYG